MARPVMTRVLWAAVVATLLGAAACSAEPVTVDPTQVSPSVTAVSGTPSAAASTGASSPSAAGALGGPGTLQEAFGQVSSGVIRLEVAGCESGSTGTGFAISDELVVTAAHVVDGGRLVRAINGNTSRAATVVGIDTQIDIALLEMVDPISGHAFEFTPAPAQVGDPVAALGYPAGSPLAFSPGTVNGVGRKAVIETTPRFGLVEFDSATTQGSSGGPLISSAGEVVAVVVAGYDGVQGRKLAVAADLAEETIAPWRENPDPLPVAPCDVVLGPDGTPVPADLAPGSHVDQVFGTLNLYFASINRGDYPTALAQFVNPVPLEAFVDGVETSNDSNFVVRKVTGGPSTGLITVWLTFTSSQQAGKGPAARPQETCTQWSLDYQMRPENGLWLIAGVRPHGVVSKPCA